MKIAGKTDVGKRRHSNQDAFSILEKKGYSLAVVCDGVGGSNGGETASDTAIHVFTASVKSSMDGEGGSRFGRQQAEDILSQASAEANAEVFRKSQEDPDLEGMATTLVAAMIRGADVDVVNIGDSRLYAFSGGNMRQITSDHSFVQYLLDKQLITPAQAKVHPNRNIILRSIGNAEDAAPDFFRLSRGEFDQLLLCTDGLYNMLTPDELISVVSGSYAGKRKPPSPRKRVAELVRRANANGGTDNITALLICEDGR